MESEGMSLRCCRNWVVAKLGLWVTTPKSMGFWRSKFMRPKMTMISKGTKREKKSAARLRVNILREARVSMRVQYMLFPQLVSGHFEEDVLQCAAADVDRVDLQLAAGAVAAEGKKLVE